MPDLQSVSYTHLDVYKRQKFRNEIIILSYPIVKYKTLLGDKQLIKANSEKVPSRDRNSNRSFFLLLISFNYRFRYACNSDFWRFELLKALIFLLKEKVRNKLKLSAVLLFTCFN